MATDSDGPRGNVPAADLGPRGSIWAAGLGLRGPRGWVYKDVDIDIPAGSLALVLGPEGSGKTSLLLSMAGRMRPTGGTLHVGGIDATRRRSAARRLVGLGEFHQVNEMDDTLTVRDQVMAELALHGRRWRRAKVEPLLDPLGHELDPHQRISDLSAPDRLLFGVALALLTDPPIVAVDRVDADLDPHEQARVLEQLRRLTERGVTVLGGALDPALTSAADVVVTLAPERAADAPASLDVAVAEGSCDAVA